MNDQDTSTIVLPYLAENYTAQPENGKFINKLISENIKSDDKNTPIHQHDTGIINEVTSNSNQHASNYTNNPRLKSLGLNLATIAESDLINGRFIPATLLNSIIEKSGKSVVLVAAGLGVGKSTASSQIMVNDYNGLGVAVSHRVKLTSQLCASFDADNYKKINEITDGESIERLGTTIQSIERMLDNPLCAPAFSGGLLTIDESNSVASEFAGKTIKNEAATLAALGKAISRAKTVLCLDAHMDSSTVSMLNAAGIPNSEMLLIEVIKPELADYTVNVVKDEKDERGKSIARPALMNQIIRSLDDGKKVLTVSMSASFLDELSEQIKKAGIAEGIKITGKTHQSVFDNLTADTYGQFNHVMLSPAMSTGISFDKDHADECYVFLSNTSGTGGYQDGLQAMMRDRSVKSREINCVYSGSDLDSVNKVLVAFERDTKVLEQILSENPEIAKRYKTVRPNHNKASKFLHTECVKQAKEKENFLELFKRECRLKGAQVNMRDVSIFADGSITSEVLLSDKKERESARVSGIVNAEKIPDDDTDLSDDQIKAIDQRSKIEKFAAIDFDDIEPADREVLVNYIAPADDVSTYKNRIRGYERALTSPREIKKLVEIALVGASNGIDDKVSFAEKMTTSKLHWPERARYTAMILKSCGVIGDNGMLSISGEQTFTSDSIKGSDPVKALYVSLKRNPEPAITSGMLGWSVNYSDVDDIKSDPFPYIIDMIKLAGVKLKKSRGVDSYTVVTSELQFDIDMINRRHHQGINENKEWLDTIQEYLEDYSIRKAKKQTLEQSVITKTPDSVAAAIGLALERCGAVDLLREAIEYLEPYHSRIKSKALSMTNVELIVRRFVDSQQ